MRLYSVTTALCARLDRIADVEAGANGNDPCKAPDGYRLSAQELLCEAATFLGEEDMAQVEEHALMVGRGLQAHCDRAWSARLVAAELSLRMGVRRAGWTS